MPDAAFANQFTLTSSRILSRGTSDVPLPNELNSSLYARSPTGESLIPTDTVCGREEFIALYPPTDWNHCMCSRPA